MKLLIASLGNRLESFVARRFEHAAWYLLVDGDMKILDSMHHETPHDRHEMMLKAVAGNVDGIVAGKAGESANRLMRTSGLRFVSAHGVSVRSVVERILSRELLPVAVEGNEKGAIVGSLPLPRLQRLKVTGGFPSDSSRRQYHLQQYGGRGH